MFGLDIYDGIAKKNYIKKPLEFFLSYFVLVKFVLPFTKIPSLKKKILNCCALFVKFECICFCSSFKIIINILFQNIQKLLGFAPSRTASKQGGGLFGPPPQQFK